ALHEPETNTPPNDLVPICSLARAIDARRILEVGTYNGASAINFALACPAATVTTYDVRAEAGEMIAAAEPAIQHRIERRVADFALDGPRLRVEPRYDFVFIDGDHKFAAVTADSALAFERVVPGGIIAWHDYRHVGHEWLSCENLVPEVLNSLAKKHAIRHLRGTTIAVLRWPAG
ncbi:MAG TPA: class I SAM-dependent methyltransferase, partial [Opitutaceae bacterium]|nr:class I SAM-dependent methyltransferase [Opitutaceae bacterium]